ncbi:MAG TPA: glucose-6-phosphate dehydrogenase assembly protein OpcA [Candidatus Dormibacteraeota bacterium]|nr:glucose-6-phosphate dehydrogenase assembly protein OpcA [Candidatus Dormibacteraeota bacterium]
MSSVQQDANPMWHGEDVTIGDVLSALSEIRYRFARAEAGDEEHLHPRNCVMTLIGIAPDDQYEKVASLATQAIGMEHPAQAIVIREDAPVTGKRLEAWITTDVRRPEVACAVECELITLHVKGPAEDHLAALLDPLLVSGVPTYLWWLGTPPFGKRELLDALRICDGLVVDSAEFDQPYNSFQRMAAMLKLAHHRMGLADLQWSRLRPWRESIAQFFSPADRRGFLTGISEVGVDYAGEGRGNRIVASLTAGWMASALGWKLRRATGGKGGVVVAHYDAGGRTVEVAFRSVPREGLVAGELSAVRIAGVSRGTSFRVGVHHNPPRARGADIDFAERRGQDTARVLLTMIEIGDGEPLRHVQQLESEDEVSLLIDLLSTGTHDEVFNRSVAAAVELMAKF